MKHVFSDISQVAHLWANQLQDNARNSGNFYFEGKTIYSYGRHFEIAKHVVKDGENVILFTKRTYSNTTAKHISIARQACSHKRVLYVPDPANASSANFEAWLHQAEASAKNLLRARKPEKYLSELSGISNEVTQYAAFFDLSIPAKLQAVLAISDKSQYAEYNAKKEAYEAEEKRKAEIELKKRHKKELNDWLKGKTNRLYVHNGVDYLRVNNGNIETSQAVKIPFEYGKKLFNKVKANTLKVGDKILDFEVQETGNLLKVGCHTFKTDYLLKFGQSVFA